MRNPTKRFVQGVGVVAALALNLHPAHATETIIRCSQLSREESEELEARVRLSLSGKLRPRSVLFACKDESAWLVWDGPPLELVDVRSDGYLVEAMLEALERRLSEDARELEPNNAEPARGAPEIDTLAATPPTTFDAPSSRVDTPPRMDRVDQPEPSSKRILGTGGFGLGMTFEAPTKHWNAAFGPKVDVGVGAGDWAFVLSESARYGKLAGDKLPFQFDTEIGASWGAPYAPERWFGLAVLAGLEWVSSDGGSIPTRVSPTTTVSARFAVPQTSITFWLGTDARVRYRPQEFNDAMSHAKPELGIILSLGAMLRVDEILRR